MLLLSEMWCGGDVLSGLEEKSASKPHAGREAVEREEAGREAKGSEELHRVLMYMCVRE